ncbi:hypothetical protein E0H86_05840 [Acinetobacter sp. ANC 4635]|uniref:hypothetical protein n=1 Tax=Acinetobacter sp. ANC 4635 TaxID=2529846 RepID=UPI001038A9D9|nr:hypothetical protein [Acinetobacter sp. ANC 4635]TCB31941.1 hypothetical protein E0H86_05840 [Acinetobacter sp. ANC 4635]
MKFIPAFLSLFFMTSSAFSASTSINFMEPIKVNNATEADYIERLLRVQSERYAVVYPAYQYKSSDESLLKLCMNTGARESYVAFVELNNEFFNNQIVQLFIGMDKYLLKENYAVHGNKCKSIEDSIEKKKQHTAKRRARTEAEVEAEARAKTEAKTRAAAKAEANARAITEAKARAEAAAKEEVK